MAAVAVGATEAQAQAPEAPEAAVAVAAELV